MGTKSWTVTIVPLILAIATFAKAYFFASDLSEQEMQMITFLAQTFITWFLGAGALGVANSRLKQRAAKI